jgi:hypothetical protein
VIKIFSTAIMSGSALAGLALAFVMAAEPAQARPGSCLANYRGCQQRCARAYSDFIPCINRTCDRQVENCERAARGGFMAGAKRTASPFTPRPSGHPGPLESGGMKPKQNGGTVPGGMRPKTGIFADGPRSGFGRR